MLTQFYQSHALLESEGAKFLSERIGSKALYDGFIDQSAPRFPAEKQIREFLTARQTIFAVLLIFATG